MNQVTKIQVANEAISLGSMIVNLDNLQASIVSLKTVYEVDSILYDAVVAYLQRCADGTVEPINGTSPISSLDLDSYSTVKDAVVVATSVHTHVG